MKRPSCKLIQHASVYLLTVEMLLPCLTGFLLQMGYPLMQASGGCGSGARRGRGRGCAGKCRPETCDHEKAVACRCRLSWLQKLTCVAVAGALCNVLWAHGVLQTLTPELFDTVCASLEEKPLSAFKPHVSLPNSDRTYQTYLSDLSILPNCYQT